MPRYFRHFGHACLALVALLVSALSGLRAADERGDDGRLPIEPEVVATHALPPAAHSVAVVLDALVSDSGRTLVLPSTAVIVDIAPMVADDCCVLAAPGPRCGAARGPRAP